MKKITLENDFHGTEITILAPDLGSQVLAYQWLENEASKEYHPGKNRAKLNKVRRTLCGMTDCKCGTIRPVAR